MRCPFCGNDDTQVKDSRPTDDGASIRRRRQCPACAGRFTTFERVQLRELTLVKKSGKREPFDRDKLARSIEIACRKRPIDGARIEQLLNEHEQRLADSPATVDAASERARRAETRFMVNEKAKAGIRELPGGILRSELRAGSGAKPKANSKVQVRYVGRLADGSVFDQSETPQWFRLDSVISGWRVALQEMPVGAKWRLVIPSAQAYGAEGAGDLIAPYTPLVFEVELLGTAD